jgi:hypothetical protein
MRISSLLLAIPVALALGGAASAAPVSSASSLAVPESSLIEVRGGHGHHYGWGRGHRRHYGWGRGHHRGWYKHHRHRRHWY